MQNRAKNAARETGASSGELIALHYHRRLIARVFDGPDAEDWVLKGGQAMLVRWPRARASTDIDFLGRQNTVEDAVAALITAAGKRLDDDIWFKHVSTSEPAHVDRPTRKVRFTAMFGTADLRQSVNVDVVAASHLPRGEITVKPLEPAFGIDCAPWPDARVFPIEDHVADKICAMYEFRGSTGTGSTRYKDFVDLVLIALNACVPGPATHRILREEATRRQLRGDVTLELPSRFHIPDLVRWTSGYAKAARGVGEIPEPLQHLTRALELGDAFMTPLLHTTPPTGDWDPAARTWLRPRKVPLGRSLGRTAANLPLVGDISVA